jgi:TolB-like protein
MRISGVNRPAIARATAVLALCAAIFFSSCASMSPGSGQMNVGVDPFGSRFLALTILEQLRSKEVLNQPIIVTTFVNLNNLNKSSVFGRAVAERLLTELHHAGFTVSEIRKGKDVFLREELGELILTRDARETMGKTHARAVLAGTYVATADSVIVNARLIDLQTPLILSSCSYTLKMTKELEKLLTGESPF